MFLLLLQCCKWSCDKCITVMLMILLIDICIKNSNVLLISKWWLPIIAHAKAIKISMQSRTQTLVFGAKWYQLQWHWLLKLVNMLSWLSLIYQLCEDHQTRCFFFCAPYDFVANLDCLIRESFQNQNCRCLTVNNCCHITTTKQPESWCK